ncbi:semaphorin-7A isoform X2 [Betta splendens]|uniref:Semaphorin-7A isoform X2 n=1 Tax=Betta splendens TaxID=158456 RepID=A0A6P7M4C6_BETSP|nr:semaphorin-7A isoform X2 [Betta splendens]
MSFLFLSLSVLSLCLSCFIEANLSNVARRTFTEKDAEVKRMPLPKDGAPVRILLGDRPDTVTVVGPSHVTQFDFQNHKNEGNAVVLSKCKEKDCDYHIAVVQRTTKAEEVFLCGAAGQDMFACCMNLTDERPTCTSSKQTQPIDSTKGGINIKEGEPSVLVESGEKVDLYVTYSGSEEQVGIHRFGEHRVGPANTNKERHYVGLLPIKEGGDPTQDKVYAFYRERNSDSELDSDTWLPFVSRVCTADVGGPKNNLQFCWTSQMNARLFCGDPDRKQHFSELVDVATVEAKWWPDTRVYGLFRNEWGMSAVCVYTMRDINNTFATSPFKDNKESKKRPRECVKDSKAISSDMLGIIKLTSEVKDWVRPENNTAPLLSNHHNYTHIYVDSSHQQRNDEHTVLFLTEQKGGIHKVLHVKTQTFVIAEYRPFNHSAHILSITLDPFSRKLYVTTKHELVQMDVGNCGSYTDGCEDCILARDPYCGWNGTQCIHKTHDSLQDVTGGDCTICEKPEKAQRHSRLTQADTSKGGHSVLLPAESRYFLSCPVSSHHAQYSWHHGQKSTSCTSNEDQCIFLIDSMNHEQEGTYKCMSEERGFTKVLSEVRLQMGNRAVGLLSGPLVWVCLLPFLVGSL